MSCDCIWLTCMSPSPSHSSGAGHEDFSTEHQHSHSLFQLSRLPCSVDSPAIHFCPSLSFQYSFHCHVVSEYSHRHPNSREKIAFMVPQGLFQFKVMLFGLTNTPAVFQQIWSLILICQNPAARSIVESIWTCPVDRVTQQFMKAGMCHLSSGHSIRLVIKSKMVRNKRKLNETKHDMWPTK